MLISSDAAPKAVAGVCPVLVVRAVVITRAILGGARNNWNDLGDDRLSHIAAFERAVNSELLEHERPAKSAGPGKAAADCRWASL